LHTSVEFYCSDDDSEPILGHWFEETILPSDSPSAGIPESGEADGKTVTTPKSSALSDDSDLDVVDKRQPESFLSLATSILKMMNSHLLDPACSHLTAYVRYFYLRSLSTTIHVYPHFLYFQIFFLGFPHVHIGNDH
jgi:hypothetical protein